MSRRGGQEEGYFERRYGGHGHFYVMNDVFLPQGIYPENFVLISQLEVCQERGGGH